MDKETLLKTEPKIAKLFINSRKKDRLAHTYLLYGDKISPLKEIAFYLAQSLNCKQDFLACNNCPSCQRFLKGIHPDFTFIDGDKETIKKEQIQNILKKYSLSAVEKGHILSLVIHKVENMTDEASNTLLKFLEEPKEEQVVFLTTYNPEKVLKTILSRCITLNLTPSKTNNYQQYLDYNYKDEKDKNYNLTAFTSYIASFLFAFPFELEENLKEDKTFLLASEVVENFLTNLTHNISLATYNLLKDTTQIKDNKCYNWIYLSLDVIFSLALNNKTDIKGPAEEVLSFLKRKENLVIDGEKILKEAINLKSLNLNPTSTLSRFLLTLDKDY